MQIFKVFPEEHAPGPPWSRFCYLSSLKLSLPKKLRLKGDENWCPLPEKNSEYTPDMKTFSKGLFTPISGSKRFYL